MNYKELVDYINKDNINELLAKTTALSDLSLEKKRYIDLLDAANKNYGDGDYHIISSPGRSETGGNHTDHQHGNVVCAALTVDNVCACKKNDSNIIRFIDPHFSPVEIDISDLSIRDDEKNSSASLIRGIAFRLKELGYKVGGFDSICDSKVLIGASISSSACFEVMVVEIFNALFNEEKIDNVTRALVGQYAENNYFGKPCGLLDQLAISQGGLTTIDFKDPSKPIIDSFDFNFKDYGYDFLIVNTKGDHSNLSHEYAAIPNEMKLVAHELGVEYLADSSLNELLKNIKTIREKIKNDRAILRAIHFFNEDIRAKEEKEAIKNKDINKMLKLMIESGKSSFEFLQNVYAASNPSSQGIGLALALTEKFLNGKGAYRLQGGGFEGTIITIVPSDLCEDYKKLMYSLFGDDCILTASIRPFGTKTII